LPDVITYEMTIPICYWTAPKSAVVVFLRFSQNPVNGGIHPVAMEIPYHRQAGEWVVKTPFDSPGRSLARLPHPFRPALNPDFP
jgi:hypothetical protein